jgi:hypothetical protein
LIWLLDVLWLSKKSKANQTPGLWPCFFFKSSFSPMQISQHPGSCFHRLWGYVFAKITHCHWLRAYRFASFFHLSPSPPPESPARGVASHLVTPNSLRRASPRCSAPAPGRLPAGPPIPCLDPAFPCPDSSVSLPSGRMQPRSRRLGLQGWRLGRPRRRPGRSRGGGLTSSRELPAGAAERASSQ